MSKKSELPHHGQILTTKAAILDDMRFERSLFKGLLYCAAAGREGGEYQAVLCGTCMKLWFLSRLVYRGKDGIAKLPAARYKRELFDTWMEDEKEIAAQLRRLNLGDADAGFVRQCVQPIELLWCQMVSCLYQQVFPAELAYAADYVLARDGRVPVPEYPRGEWDLFPANYENFNCAQSDIAAYCSRVFGGF